MTHRFDPNGGPISCNITAGQNLGATVRVSIYGPDNHLIEKIAAVVVKDSDVPEYAIDKKHLKLPKFTVVHRYKYASAGPGEFQAITVISQPGGSVSPPVSRTPTIKHTGYGRYDEHIEFEAV